VTNGYSSNSLWRRHLFIDRTFTAWAAVKQPCRLWVESVRVALEVFGCGLEPPSGVDRAADDHSVEALRVHIVRTRSDDDIHTEGLELTSNCLGDLLR
jgi:hypothetical protein